MSDYKNAPNWTLLNQWTIHEDKRRRDRPLMRTCVPQRIEISLHNIVVKFGAHWGGDSESLFEKPKNPRHRTFLQINGFGLLKDSIHAFTMRDGLIDCFECIHHVEIFPINQGLIGGDNNSSNLESIKYSGWSSREVPDGGLMNGEPGYIFWEDAREDRDLPDEERHIALWLGLYLEREAFDALVPMILTAGERIERGVLVATIELFQDEANAALSEPWMSQEYGLLVRDDKSGSVAYRARLESLSLATRPLATLSIQSDSEIDATDDP